MENKNLFLAVVLSVAFMFIWSTFVIPRYATKTAPAPAASSAAPSAPATSGQAPASVGPAHADSGSPRAAAKTIHRDANNEIVFNPEGGAIEHWRLKLKGQEIDLVEKPAFEPLPLATDSGVRFS